MQFDYHGEVQRSWGGMQCNAQRGDWVTQPMKHRRTSFLFPPSSIGREKEGGKKKSEPPKIANSPGTIHLQIHL